MFYIRKELSDCFFVEYNNKDNRISQKVEI